MRDELSNVRQLPDHPSLAYHAWAPADVSGKVSDNERPKWLDWIVNTCVPTDYARFFDRWKASFREATDAESIGDHTFTLELGSRLLIGSGNSSGSEIGLTLHHTWGVPVIPGSALKGVLAHFVDATMGPPPPDAAPWQQLDGEREREAYQGVTWGSHGAVRGPGSIYRLVFGAPDTSGDDEMRGQGFDAGAAAGLVTFHDALYMPGSVAGDKPLAVDVLTVHQKRYYDASGGHWPNDYDNPVPVSFLTVRPGAKFLVALSGPPSWTALVAHLVPEALASWGIGGKTSAGYGRLVEPGEQVALNAEPVGTRSADGRRDSAQAAGSLPRVGETVTATLVEEKTRRGGWKARHDPSGLVGPIQNSPEVDPGAKPGDKLELGVRAVTPQIAFQVPVDRPTPTREQSHVKRGKRGRR
jgi:CRISPR-associated protein Cmr6